MSMSILQRLILICGAASLLWAAFYFMRVPDFWGDRPFFVFNLFLVLIISTVFLFFAA